MRLDTETMKEVAVNFSDIDGLSVYETASFYVENGLSVIPIRRDGSKAPAVSKWKPYQSTMATGDELKEWFHPIDSLNGIGIVCGKISGNLEVLDIEGRFMPYFKEFVKLVKEAIPDLLGRLVKVKTPANGIHYYYRCDIIEGSQDLALNGNGEKYIETRGEGGYIIAPGSPADVHPMDAPYELRRGSFNAIPTILPEERNILLDCARGFNEYVKLIKPEKFFKPDTNPRTPHGTRPGDAFCSDPNIFSQVSDLLKKHGCTINGNRVTRPFGDRPSASLFSNGVLFNFSTNWKGLEPNKAYSPFSLYGLLEFDGDFKRAAKELLKQGYGKQESYFIGDDQAKVTLGTEKSIDTADDVFSLIIENLPNRVDYKAEAGLKENDPLGMKDFVVITAEKIISTAKSLGFNFRVDGNLYVYNSQYWIETNITRDKIDSLIPFLTSSIEAMGLWGVSQKYHTFIDSLCKQFIVSVLSLSFRQNKTASVLINFKNGTLEISESGYRLRSFDSKDFLTYQLQFDYDEDAASPRWDKFLDEVLPASKNDPTKSRQKVLAEYYASSFTNLNLEKCLFNYGTGDNGKSVVFNVITALFGSENISYCSLENLARHDSYLASLNNKLLNYSSETSHYVDSELLKKLVSREPIEVARKYENPITMTNYARLAFNANELPRAGKEYLHAFKRRFVIIPFDVRIEKSKIDPYLADRIIKNELPGVMNWLLRGLDRLLERGRLTECEASDREVDAYMGEGDTVKQWLEDEEWIKDEALKQDKCVQLKDLYKDYLKWCEDYRQSKTLGRDQFKKRLSDMHDIRSFEYGHKQYYRLKKRGQKIFEQ